MSESKPQKPWKASEIETLKRKAAAGESLAHMAQSIGRTQASIKCKLFALDIKITESDKIKKRKCSNWDSTEIECREMFVSKYAGPCPKCRIVARRLS